MREEKTPSHWQRPVERDGHGGYATPSENSFEERKKIQPSNAIPATRISFPAPPKGPELVTLYNWHCICKVHSSAISAIICIFVAIKVITVV